MQESALVVDDDEPTRVLICKTLEDEGLICTAAESVRSAIAVLQGRQFDVLILDVMLTDGSGLDIAREISRTSQTAIIMVSARGEETDHVIGLEVGADDYVTKPIRPRELRARVRAVLRRKRKFSLADPTQKMAPDISLETHSQSKTTDVLELDPLEIDTASRTVFNDQVEINLTTLEFDTLVTLAMNKNRVLSRSQIMDSVRGEDWAAYDRTIDGVISRLRKKCYPDGSGAKYLKTIRGAGYMLTYNRRS